jgi:hypothetical protein
MNFDDFFADFCSEIVIYRYYQNKRRLIVINHPNLGDFDDIGKHCTGNIYQSSKSIKKVYFGFDSIRLWFSS